MLEPSTVAGLWSTFRHLRNSFCRTFSYVQTIWCMRAYKLYSFPQISVSTHVDGLIKSSDWYLWGWTETCPSRFVFIFNGKLIAFETSNPIFHGHMRRALLCKSAYLLTLRWWLGTPTFRLSQFRMTSLFWNLTLTNWHLSYSSLLW